LNLELTKETKINNKNANQDKSYKKLMSESKFAFLLLLPTIILVLGLLMYPFIYSIYLSFVNLNLTKPWIGPQFVGLKNFTDILQSTEFWSSMKVTGYFTIFSVIGSLLFGLIAALILNQHFKFRGIARSMLLIPWAISGVINGLIWQWILHPNYGVLNGALTQLGITKDYIAWLSDPFLAVNMVILADVWKSFPFVALLLLAALQSIPSELYEAAKVDGANAFSIFRRITLPLLAPITLVLLVLRTIDSFRIFDLIYVLTKGGPANATQVVGYYLYKEGFEFANFGYSAAGSYVITFFILILVFIYVKKLDQNESF